MNICYTKIIIAAAILILCSSLNVSAEYKNIEIDVDKNKVPLSGSIRLDLTFDGVENMTAMELPDIDGFESSFLRSANIISKSDGALMRSTRHTYLLMPKKTGLFKIGPFKFDYDNKTYISKEIDVQILSGIPRMREEDEISAEEKFRSKENIFLVIEINKDKVYVNELFQLEAKLYFKDIQITDIKFPTIEQNGFLLGEFSAPSKSKKSLKGYSYNLVSFRTSIFATKPGDLILGPATISCNYIPERSGIGLKEAVSRIEKYSSSGIFGENGSSSGDSRKKKKPLQIESEAKSISVLPLPDAGKPDNFSGGVGDFDFKLSVSPKGDIKIGDAITLSMEISGKGNLSMIMPPDIIKGKDFIPYEPYLKEQGRSYRIYEQVIIPKNEAFQKIPRVSFSYFDPKRSRYITIEKGSIPIRIIRTKRIEETEIAEDLKESAPDREKEIAGKDIVYIKDSAGRLRKKGAYLYRNRIFLSLHILPFALYMLILIFHRRYERFKNDISYARYTFAYKKAKKALAEAKSLLINKRPERFYASLFVAIQEYLGDKFNLAPGGITADIIDDTLRPRNFDGKILDEINLFFKEYDIARFTPHKCQEKEMAGIFKSAQVIVEYFKKI